MFAWLLLVSRADRSRALRLRAGSGGSCRRLAPSVQLARPPTLLRPGQPPAAAALAATSTAGKGRPYRAYRGGGGGRRGVAAPGSLRHSCGFGQPPAAAALAATSTAGDRMAVQGVSCRRWRCWPSVLESSFSGWIQGVEAVEVGGSGGSCAACWPPAVRPQRRAYCVL